MGYRFPRFMWTQCRRLPLFFDRDGRRSVSSVTNRFRFSTEIKEKVVTKLQSSHCSDENSVTFLWRRSSSYVNERDSEESASSSDTPDPTEASFSKETGSYSKTDPIVSGAVRRRRKGVKRVAFSDSDSESNSDSDLCDLSRDDLVKRVAKKEQLLDAKQEELEKMKDKVLRTFAEMENLKERTWRESENAKKFAIQNFAKSLLDVSDNLGRASSAAKESFSKIDSSEDAGEAGQQLKTLLEGVEMTEKQLSEVFKKFGLEKYDPINEEFDPNRHNAVFQVPDASKPASQVAYVLKAGYMLHDRVIRPADVGVTVAMSN